MLEIRFSKQSAKFIQKELFKNKTILASIREAINSLRQDPLPAKSKSLKGYPGYRIRVGKYRIVYEFTAQVLYITLVEKRDTIYKLLNKN